MQSRLLRSAATIGLLGLAALGACKQDADTHVAFHVGASTDAAGAPGTAGTGIAGTGTAGASGTDGGASDATTTTTKDGGATLGCGMDPGQIIGQYVEYHLSISGPDVDATNKPKVRDRIYYVRLPKTYDGTTPMRVVYLGTGCGGTTPSSVINLNTASMEQAILVAPMPLLEFNQCFDETITSVEYPFFDALHKKIEASFCVDPARQFYAGFSTGAWFGNMLGCVFPDVLRAYATIQGGLPPLPACKDLPIASFTLADTLETGNPYQSNVMASQRVQAANKCVGTATATYDTGPDTTLPPTASCVSYTGCPKDEPVVFCTTSGQGHQQFEPFSDYAFWNFFKQF
jgi:poly(3-hydroxybutyrate) depolymerase